MDDYIFNIASAAVISALAPTLTSAFGSEKITRAVRFCSAVVVCALFFAPLGGLLGDMYDYIDSLGSQLDDLGNDSASLYEYGTENLESAVKSMIIGRFGLDESEVAVTVFTEADGSGGLNVLYAEVCLSGEARKVNTGELSDYVSEILQCGVRIRGN